MIVTETDDDMGSATHNMPTVTVDNQAATIIGVTVAPNPVQENAPVTVTGSFSDVGTQDTHTVSVAWDDGTPDSAATVTEAGGSGTFIATHIYADDNPTMTPQDNVTIFVTVTDDDTGATTDSGTVLTIENVAPAVRVSGTQAIDEGALLSITDIATFVDPGFGMTETFTYSIAWGDGADPDQGRPGLSFWQVFVLSSVRLGANITYDHLHYLVGGDRNLRAMMQVGDGGENDQRKRASDPS